MSTTAADQQGAQPGKPQQKRERKPRERQDAASPAAAAAPDAQLRPSGSNPGPNVGSAPLLSSNNTSAGTSLLHNSAAAAAGAIHSSTASAAAAGTLQRGKLNGGINPASDLFSHLPLRTKVASSELNQPSSADKLHPAIVSLGLMFNRNTITGATARALAFIDAFLVFIADYVPSPDKELSRDLDLKLRPHFSFISRCRTLPVSIRNIIRYMKMLILTLDVSLSLDEIKDQITTALQSFAEARIRKAGDEIIKHGQQRIKPGDVILVYATSSVVIKMLVAAKHAGIDFSTIVVDSRPRFEGQGTLKRLSAENIPCTYVHLTALSYKIKQATKVFLGAHTFFQNGTLMARLGTAIIALAAKQHNIPVLSFCEIFKFWDHRIQTESFGANEVDYNDYLRLLNNYGTTDALSLTNLVYDVTPAELISAIVTEVGLIPCSSVPVLLREYDVTRTD